MKRAFFISDTHFGHGNIIKYCNRNDFLSDSDLKEFERIGKTWHSGDWKGNGSSHWRISREAIDTMDDKLINNINSIVGENDVLYHLGDFCFAPKHEYYKAATNYRKRINCKEIHFVFGNHDQRSIGNLFSTASDMLNINVNNQRIVLCHYAMAVWDKSHRGAWQLYGHSHANLEKFMDTALPGHLSMDVGVDNAKLIVGEYRPFSFEEISQIMTQRKGFFPDHHGKNRGMTNTPTEEELAH